MRMKMRMVGRRRKLVFPVMKMVMMIKIVYIFQVDLRQTDGCH